MPSLGAPELLIVLFIGVFSIVPLVIGVVALIDIAQRTDEQMAAAGQSRTTWLIVAVLSLVLPCLFLGSAYYLLAIRPKLPARRVA